MKASRFVVALGVIIAGVAGGILIRSQLSADHALPAASAGQAECKELVAGFTEYPLVNAGDEYDGLSLTACFRRQTPAKLNDDGSVRESATDLFTFIYGDCSIAEGAEGCTAPLQITIAPPCDAPLSARVVRSQTQARGAAVTVKNDGSLYVDSGGMRIHVFTGGTTVDEREARGLAVVAALRGANAVTAAIQPNGSLAQPLAQGVACP